MTDIKQLRALCDAATQGDWYVGEANEILCIDKDGAVDNIVETDGGYYPPKQEDAAFIAATDPQTVRGLIDEVEQMQAAIRELRASLDGCLGHMTGGMDGTWSEEFDPIHGARQTLENTKKWSEE